MTPRGKRKYLGFLIPPNFPQDFTVAPHFPSSYRGNFLFHFLKTHVAKGPRLPLYPLPPSHKYSLFTEAIFSPPRHMSKASSTACLCPSPNSQPLWPEGSSPLAAGQTFPISLLSLLIFLSPVPALSWMFSFLYLFLASPSPKADKDAGMRGSVGEAGATGDKERQRRWGAQGSHGPPKLPESLSPWEEEDCS